MLQLGSSFRHIASALATAAALQRLAPDAPAWQTVPLGAAVAAGTGLLCGFVNGALVTGLRVHPFIITLGTLSIFRGIALVAVPEKTLPSLSAELPRSFTKEFVGWRLDLGAGAGTFVQPVPLLVMLACAAWAWWWKEFWTSSNRRLPWNAKLSAKVSPARWWFRTA